jgi:Holliday junction DNA helicase RuvB
VSDERLTTPDRRPDDVDAALRPKSLDEFVGQQAARRICACSSMRRGGAGMRSTMSCSSGPPGLGKTTLAQIIARELGVGFAPPPGR